MGKLKFLPPTFSASSLLLLVTEYIATINCFIILYAYLFVYHVKDEERMIAQVEGK